MVAAIASEPSMEHRIILPFATPEAAEPFAELVGRERVRSLGASRRRELLRARAWVGHHVGTASPNVLHAHLFHAAVLVGSLPKRSLPATVLTHHHGSWLPDQHRRVEARLDRWVGLRFDHVVAVSGAVADFLKVHYGYPQQLIDVIPNGWTGRPVPRRPGTGPDFVSVGHLRWEKGHDVLLKAFVEVLGQESRLRLRIVGEGRRRPSLERLASDLGVADAVEFTGAVRDVWPHYAEAGVAVVPSRTEPQGIVVLEALASGCPLVATRVGGIPEMVEDGRTARLVPPEDPSALAAGMLELHRSSELRASFAAEGQRVAERWPMSATVAGYARLYRRIAG